MQLKKNKTTKAVFFILAAMFLIVFLIEFLLAYIPAQMSEKHTNEIVNLYFQDTKYTLEAFNESWQPSTHVYKLSSVAGHTIPVYYICQDKEYENKTIILVHWHESNHMAMYPLAEVFLENGWNVVLYDQRAHGKNTAATVTFGYLESLDLEQVVNFAKEKSNNNTVGALGQSMGASTIAYYSGTEHANEHLDFAVIDCPFSSMYDEIYWEISQAKILLPAKALTSFGSVFNNLIYGYSFSDVDMVEQIKNNNIPTLIMHSKVDRKCPYYMSENLFNEIPHSKKKLITYKGSEHLFSFWDEQDRYNTEIFSFIEKYIN